MRAPAWSSTPCCSSCWRWLPSPSFRRLVTPPQPPSAKPTRVSSPSLRFPLGRDNRIPPLGDDAGLWHLHDWVTPTQGDTVTHENRPTPRRANRLYRDPIDKKIGGVAAGVAKYFDIDTTLVRAVWAVSILVGGFGLLLYLVLWFILDDDPDAFADPIEPRDVEPAGLDTTTEADGELETAENDVEPETADADATTGEET
ncbi:MAG: PspC domain-containing protein [Acidimicrobiia bacterium]|nr:PspC domain-containing protein [Acidimicrobiia bacterium]